MKRDAKTDSVPGGRGVSAFGFQGRSGDERLGRAAGR